jgi:hypothetical protein
VGSCVPAACPDCHSNPQGNDTEKAVEELESQNVPLHVSTTTGAPASDDHRMFVEVQRADTKATALRHVLLGVMEEPDECVMGERRVTGVQEALGAYVCGSLPRRSGGRSGRATRRIGWTRRSAAAGRGRHLPRPHRRHPAHRGGPGRATEARRYMGRERLSKARVHPIESESDDTVLLTEFTA